MASLIPQVRKELRILHGLLRHGETAAEIAAFERIGPLHDQLAAAEATIVAVQVSNAKLVPLGVLPKQAEDEFKDVLAYADQRAKEIAQQAAIDEARRKAEQARRDTEAAKTALAVESAAPPATS